MYEIFSATVGTSTRIIRYVWEVLRTAKRSYWYVLLEYAGAPNTKHDNTDQFNVRASVQKLLEMYPAFPLIQPLDIPIPPWIYCTYDKTQRPSSFSVVWVWPSSWQVLGLVRCVVSASIIYSCTRVQYFTFFGCTLLLIVLARIWSIECHLRLYHTSKI